MSVAISQQKTWTREELDTHPFIVIYELTRACHLACVHCRAEAQPHPHPLELRTDESLRLLDDIAALKPDILVLTGGDPLLRADLETLIRYAVARGLRVSITPSVTRKVTDAAITHLKEWGISQIAFSLDGANPAVHDGFRKVPGTFERTLRAMARAKEVGLSLQINTSVTKATVADLPGIAKIAERFAIQLWSLFFVVPTGRATSSTMLSPSEHESIYEYLTTLSRQVSFGIKTTAAPAYRRVVVQQALMQTGSPLFSSGRAPIPINDGLGFVFISHTGGIYPSGFLPLAAGNVRSHSLMDVYRNHPLFRALRDTELLHGKCGVCEFRTLCGGSRARAFAVYGDPQGSDPSCAYVPPAYIASPSYQDEPAPSLHVTTGVSAHQEQADKPPIGVLVMAYGTPASPEEIEPYYTHVRHGHRPSPELLADLERRYAAIGGISPLTSHTLAQGRGLQQALDHAEPDRYRVVLGMKHVRPFIEDSLAELVREGISQVVGLVLAPHYSALSVGEYIQRARAANTFPVKLSFVEHWYQAPGYIAFLAREVHEAVDAMSAEYGINHESIEVLITAHSLPARILNMDDPYPQQLREMAEAVATRASISRWSIAWQSAGRTSEAWLGPNLLDVLAELPARGVKGVVVCPAGFVSEHLEILYDLDIEARRAAERLGLAFGRTGLPNDDPNFLSTLAEVIRAHVNAEAANA